MDQGEDVQQLQRGPDLDHLVRARPEPVPGAAAGGDPAPEAHARPDPLAAGDGQHAEHLGQVPVEQDVQRRGRRRRRVRRPRPGRSARSATRFCDHVGQPVVDPAQEPLVLPGRSEDWPTWRPAGPAESRCRIGRPQAPGAATGATSPEPPGQGCGDQGCPPSWAICCTAHGLKTNGVSRAASVTSVHLTHFQSRTSSGFGSSGSSGCDAGRRAAKHRAHLVLHDAAGIGGPVGEVGQHALQVVHLHAQLVADSRRRMAAGIDSPGRGWPQHVLVQTPGQVGLARARRVSSTSPAVVEHVQRERQVQRRVPAVHLAYAGHVADRLALAVQQDDLIDNRLEFGRRRRHARNFSHLLEIPTPPQLRTLRPKLALYAGCNLRTARGCHVTGGVNLIAFLVWQPAQGPRSGLASSGLTTSTRQAGLSPQRYPLRHGHRSRSQCAVPVPRFGRRLVR